MDIAKGEAVEHELDAMIRRRHDQRTTEEAHRPSEELWAESVRVYNARREVEAREAWAAYHRSAAERIETTAAQIAAEHRARAEMLLPNGREETA